MTQLFISSIENSIFSSFVHQIAEVHEFVPCMNWLDFALISVIS